MSSEMTSRWAVREAETEAGKELGQPSDQLWNLPDLTSRSPALRPTWHREENNCAGSEQQFWSWRSSGKKPRSRHSLSGPVSKLPAPSLHPRHPGVLIAALSLKQVPFLLITFLTEIFSHRMFLASGRLRVPSAVQGLQSSVPGPWPEQAGPGLAASQAPKKPVTSLCVCGKAEQAGFSEPSPPLNPQVSAGP